MRITRLYFRVLVPVVAMAILWTMLVPTPSLNVPVLVFTGLLLLAAAVYSCLPPRWEWGLRLSFALGHLLFLLALALFSDQLGIPHAALLTARSIVLLLTPVTVLAWSMLFFDRPRIGRLLSFSLALLATLLTVRWNAELPEASSATSVLLLIICLVTHVFGWAVTGLQRRLTLGERHARLDALTGLLNRRAFEEACEGAAPPGVLAVLDIDHFKQVNDRHGHEAGDRVLRSVADVLLDTVGGCGRVYRWGGEEFAVCLPDACAASAHDLLEQVRHEVARRSFIGGQHVTLSIGLSAYGPGLPLRRAFTLADAALRSAKATGRDRIVVAAV
ncbi:hypothetical protein Dcar01_03292 [Deinococcus carri]|uniref:GGDEF domain-containing protein n=2 Tax=Deinococcus carri TaxID=1211323 RepID=A0ABP9WBY1_9DEIO